MESTSLEKQTELSLAVMCVPQDCPSGFCASRHGKWKTVALSLNYSILVLFSLKLFCNSG